LIGPFYGQFYDCIEGYFSNCQENGSGTLYFNYQYDQNGFIKADVSFNVQYNIYKNNILPPVPSASELIECYEGRRDYYDCYMIFRSTFADTLSINNRKYIRFYASFISKDNPFLTRSVQGRRRLFYVGILYANYYSMDYYAAGILALYAPIGYYENYEIHQKYWDLEITEITYTVLCKLIYFNYSERYENCVLERSESSSTAPVTESWKEKKKIFTLITIIHFMVICICYFDSHLM
jgi:hypothetical protein